MIADLLARCARWVVRHRRAVLLAVVLLTVGLLRGAGRLHVEVNPDHLLPQEHPYIQALNDVHRLFGDKNLVVIGLFPHDGNVYTPAFLRKLAEVTANVEKIPGVNPALVQSLAAAHVKDIRGTADGMEVEPVMDAPPADQAGADEVRRRVLANDAYVDTLVAADGSAAGVQASFELTADAPDYRKLHQRVLDAVSAAQDGTFDVALSGPVVFLSTLTAYASRIGLFFPIALVVIALVHYEAFRTVQALLLPLVTGVLSVLWAIGLMGVLGIQFDGYNVSTPILILAVAAGHAVQVLKRFYEEFDRTGDVEEAIVRALRRVGPVMLAAGTAAALSFCSLGTFGLATIRTFGLLTGFGIFSAMAIELTVIPALRASLPAPRGRETAREAKAHPVLDRLLGAFGAAAARPNRVLWLTVVLLAACALLGARVRVDMSYKRSFGAHDAVRNEDARINTSLAGTNTLVLLVEGTANGSLEEPAVMRAIDGLERRLEAEAGVGKALSYVDFVKKMHAAMNGDLADAGTLPVSRALTAQYLFLYSLSGGGESLDTLVEPTHRIAKIRILTHEDSTRFGDRLIALARDTVARTFPAGYSVRYTGSLASTSAGTQTMVEGKVRNIFQIAVIVFTIAALLLRSLVGGLLVATPLALTVAVNFGVMGALGLPLDTNTATIAAIAVGIGADYAIYFLFRVREELAHTVDLETALGTALETSGKAVLFVSSAIAAGYATLCFSGFSHYLRVGSLVALAMVVSSASALVLIPALVTRFRPSFLWAETGEARETTPPERERMAAA